jgi:hypothetical protein
MNYKCPSPCTHTHKYILDKVVTREVEKIKQVPVSVERLVPRQNVSLFPPFVSLQDQASARLSRDARSSSERESFFNKQMRTLREKRMILKTQYINKNSMGQQCCKKCVQIA